MKLNINKTYTLELSEEEFKILSSALGYICNSPKFCENIYNLGYKEFGDHESFMDIFTGTLHFESKKLK